MADEQNSCHRIRVPFWIFCLDDYIIKRRQFARSIPPETAAARRRVCAVHLDRPLARLGFHFSNFFFLCRLMALNPKQEKDKGRENKNYFQAFVQRTVATGIRKQVRS